MSEVENVVPASSDESENIEQAEDTSYAGTTPAAEFPDGLHWLNTEQPLSIADLRGKLVLLDFWTYGCINCMHNIPGLKQLEAEYANELVVIGGHSGGWNSPETCLKLDRWLVATSICSNSAIWMG